jgi:hypothetical protein
MRRKWSIADNPLAWANVIFIILVYGLFGALAFVMGRTITWQEAGAIWPLHVILAINLLGIFGPRPPRA